MQQTCSPGELKAGDSGWEVILDLLETEEGVTLEMLHIPPCADHTRAPAKALQEGLPFSILTEQSSVLLTHLNQPPTPASLD